MYEKRKSDKHGIRDKEREEDKDKMETDPSLRSCKGRGIDRSHGHDKGLSISASFSIIFTGILIVWAVFGASALIADSEEAGAVNFQDGSDFYDNFELSYTPEAPNPDEGVWVTLESKTQDNITQAHLYFQYREEGEEDFSEAGGNLMEEGENETVRNGLISDEYHAPGTEVRFWVNATYDEIDWYRSDNYTYTVSDEGGWISEDFDDNLVVDFTPKEPRADERVNITLVKTHEAEENDVQMNSAVLRATIDQPERSPQEASAVFERENETWRTSIPGYPQNTSVTFYVEATDIHGEQLISDELGYTVMKEVQSVQPLVIVYDPLNERYVDGAVVRVENSSGVVFEGTTEDGQLTVGEPLQPGTYTLTIDYADKTETRELQLTGEETEEDVTFRFEMEDRGSLEHELISFPQWSSVAGLIAAIFLPLLLLGWTYKKKEEKKIDLAEGDKGESRQNGNVWVEKIVKKVIEETRDPEYLIPAGFFLLSVCGLVFIPFYPFWMILLLSVVVGAVAYKYPLNALLILAVLVTGSAAYQTPEFGLVFLVFSLLVMLASFFDWRFGFLVFSMVFLARFGALYFVPVMSVFLFSSFLAIISTAAAGTFLVMLSSSGNWELMGFVTSAPHHSSFMRFDRPVVSNFSPSSLGSALNSVGSANPNIIQTILSNNFGASVLPFIQILLWTVAIYLLSRITEARGPKFDRLKEWLRYPLRKEWRISLASALLLGASPLIGLLYFGYIFDMGLVGIALSVGILVGGVALAYVAQGLGYMTKSMFREYYRSKLGISDVGTRIAEMADLGETPFENVGGLEDVKQDVKESILLPLLRPDISKKFGVETSKGLLLYGPPGCGKTLLMKALATELDIEMINVKCGDVMSRWYGESEDSMMKLFEAARERKPCIIFFDEIDAIAKKRDMYSADDVTPRLLSLLLSELDGMDRAEGIIMVGSTNKPEMVDPALLRPGRFDKIIYVPPPDKEERKDILDIHLKDKPVSSEIDLDKIARKTEGFSGADLANLAKESATQTMRKSLDQGGVEEITEKEINQVLKQMSPSITPSMKEEYERVRSKYERKMHEVKRPEMERGITLTDIPNLSEAKKVLKDEILLPLTESDLVEEFDISGAKNLLLYGPKGCQKLDLVKGAGNEVGIPMRVISGREFKEVVSEEGRRAMENLYKEMRDIAPSVIVISEIDKVAGVEISGMSAPKALAALLNLLDNIKDEKEISLVATTHYPNKIKGALFERGRLGKTVYIPAPDFERRSELFINELESVPSSSDIDYGKLAELTEGFTSDDIRGCVEEGKIKALSKGKKDAKITQEMLEEVIEETSSSLTDEMLESVERFEKERD